MKFGVIFQLTSLFPVGRGGRILRRVAALRQNTLSCQTIEGQRHLRVNSRGWRLCVCGVGGGGLVQMSWGFLPCGSDLDLQTGWRLNTRTAITSGRMAEPTRNTSRTGVFNELLLCWEEMELCWILTHWSKKTQAHLIIQHY